MTKSFRERHRSLSITNHLCVSYVLNVAFWFISSLLWEILVKDQLKPILYLIGRAAFIAFFWTIYFNWSLIKAVFRGNKT